MKSLIQNSLFALFLASVLLSCSTQYSTRAPANEEDLKASKLALINKYKKSSDLVAFAVEWIKTTNTDLLQASLGSENQSQIIIHYGKQAYFSYNRLMQFHVGRATTMAQMEALDKFFDYIETKLKTGQSNGIGPDRILYDLTPREQRPQYSFHADENFSDPGASSRNISKTHESNRLAHLMNAYLTLITGNEDGAEKFEQIFNKIKGLEAVQEYNSFHGNSSASSSFWRWSSLNLDAMVKALHFMAKDETAFRYVTELLEVLPVDKVMTSSRYFSSPWEAVPNLDSPLKRQAYGALYYSLIDRAPLKANFNGMGEQYRIETAHSPELMKNRRINLNKAMGSINFDYFDSPEKVASLVKSIDEIKSAEELVFLWKTLAQGQDPQEEVNLVKAKLRRYGMVSELSHEYVLLPIEIQGINIQGPVTPVRRFVDIGRGRFPHAWSIEMDNRGGYETKERGRFYIHETREYFDGYAESLTNKYQLQALEKFLDKLGSTKLKTRLNRSSRDIKITDYLFHEVSSPIEQVKSLWLRNLAIDLKTASYSPFQMLAESGDEAFRLIFFEHRVIQSITTQEDLEAYVKLSKLFSTDVNMDRSGKLWDYLNDNKEASPRHLLHIMEKWENFAKAEKIELSPETFAELRKVTSPPPSALKKETPIPIAAPEVKAKSNACLGMLRAFLGL